MSASISHDQDADLLAAAGARPEHRLLITQTRALSYRVPGKSRVRPMNYIVELRGEVPEGTIFTGLGEGQPRGALTGDTARESWQFLKSAVAELEGQELRTASPAEAIENVRKHMVRLTDLAQRCRGEVNEENPFRGVLFGLETALLDLAARAQEITLAQLLGQLRDTAPLSPPALAPNQTFEVTCKTLRRQGSRYPVVRLTGRQTVGPALDALDMVAAAARRRDVDQADKLLWIDLNGALTREDAERFAQEVTESAVAGLLPRRMIIEQPVSGHDGDHLPVLQRRVDACMSEAKVGSVDVRVMADRAVQGLESFHRLRDIGGLKAVNIRPAQVGGLLPSIELAHAVLHEDPHAFVALSRMRGAGRITRIALSHLALALPKVDSTMVVSSVEKYFDFTEVVLTAEEQAQRQTLDEASVGTPSLPPDDVAEETSAVEQAQGESDGGEYESLDEEADEDDEELSNEPAEELQASGGLSEDERTQEETDDEDERSDDDADESSLVRTLSIRDVPGLGLNLVYRQLITPTINYVTFPEPPPPSFNGKIARTYDDVDYIRPLGAYGIHGHIVEREALAYGLNTKRFNKSTFLVDDGHQEPLAFRTARWPLSSVVASSLVRHKESTRLLLNRHKVPVPMGRTFSNADADGALQYAKRIGYPVVLKPAAGSMGVGVTANIANDEELLSALGRLHDSIMGTGEFIVEQHIPGKDYRIMVVGDEVIAAVERLPASVLGDGNSTVAELVLAKNAVRKLNSHLGPLTLKWNAATEHELGKQGVDANTVLEAGQRLHLNSVNNLTQGGDSVEVLDELHPSIVQASIDAVKAVPGLTYCGVDFLLEDHTKSLDEQFGAVCELNAVAAIPVAEYPVFGQPRPLSQKFMMRAIGEFNLKASSERSERLNIRMKVRGKVSDVGYHEWFARRANRFGCSGWIRPVTDRELEIRVAGPTAAVAALAAAAVQGPARANPTSVRTIHCEDSLEGEFQVISTHSAGVGGSAR